MTTDDKRSPRSDADTSAELVDVTATGAVHADDGTVSTMPAGGKYQGKGEDLEPGATVGRYVVLEQVGTGGMGVVYSAYDPELDRRIALKVLRPRRTSATARDRLLREAKAIAQVSHPNVVHAYDVGVSGKQVFIAMEYIDGQSLRAWCGAAERSWRECLDHYIAAGHGLAAAHAAGLIHRDFKPSNVLIGNDGAVCVADFGLAARRDSDEPTPSAPDTPPTTSSPRLDERMTVTGTVLGTPAFMAPEQHLGRDANEKTDQYSYCVSLYAGLYGKRPFTAHTKEPGQRLLSQKIKGDVAAPAPASDVPGWLHQAVMRGLEPHPDDRWPSMNALLAALSHDPAARLRRSIVGAVIALLAALAVAATVVAMRRTAVSKIATCPLPAERVAALWNQDHATAIARQFAATKISYAGDAWQLLAPRLEERATAWGEMHVAACQAHARGEQSGELLDRRMACLHQREAEIAALIAIFRDADGKVVAKAAEAVAGLAPLSRCADKSLLFSELTPPDDPAVAAAATTLRDELARIQVTLAAGRYPEALAAARLVAERAQTISYPPVEAEALFWRGELEQKSGDYERAEATLTEAFWRAQASKHDVVAIRAAIGLTYLTGIVRPREEAAALWLRASAAMVDRGGGDPVRRADLAFSRGLILDIRGDYADALAELNQALTLRQEAFGVDHLLVAIAHESIGRVSDRLGKHQAAIDHFGRAQIIREQIQGKEHPDLASNMGFRAITLFRLGKYAATEPLFARVLSIREQTLGADHGFTAWAHHNLGETLLALRQLDRAQTHLARARAIQEKSLPADDPHQVFALTNHAKAALLTGDSDAARRHLERALAVVEDKLGADHPWLYPALLLLGEVMVVRGDHASARASCERAHALANRPSGPDQLEIAAALLCLAKLDRSAGNTSAAVKRLDKALAAVEDSVGAEHELALLIHNELGHIAAGRGDSDRARRHFRRAISMSTAIYGGPHPHSIGALGGLARGELRHGTTSAAITTARRALAIADTFATALTRQEQAEVASVRKLLTRAEAATKKGR